MFLVLECDKAICLNELGRMMSWYGDRQYSGTFFRKSLDVMLELLKDQSHHTLMNDNKLEYIHPKLVLFYCKDFVVLIIKNIQVQTSTYAMMASAWDVGYVCKCS